MKLIEQSLLGILHKLNPEDANSIALRALEAKSFLPGQPKSPITRHGQTKKLMGLDFANPCGIAAGLDKNGDCINGLISLGAGFIELGTVTPLAQSGNSGTRILRLVKEEAMINRLGFNNKGCQYLLNRLNSFRDNYRTTGSAKTIIGVNIGKGINTLLENATDDYVHSMQLVHSVADYITINISSPNTPGLRKLQNKDKLSSLLDIIKNAEVKLQQVNNKKCPLVLKLSPDMDEDSICEIAKTIMQFEVDGIIATNTSVEHPWRNKMAGGISGKPLAEASIKVLRVLRKEMGDKIVLISTGGIDSSQEMQKRLTAGADLIQLYTALIYKGSGLINDLAV